jgi:phospholipid/cholesterol/gamma-HCH transport system substrate-binding protein
VIPRRVLVNLAAFGALFLLLCSWALGNVVHLDAIERPWKLAAEFEAAPGLRPNVEVTYLGVRVGKIRSLELTPRAVVVEMRIDRDQDLPRGVLAAIRRKSAVGEPYVALEPPAGYERGGPRLDHDEHHVIPLGSTSVPLSYGDLFVALDDLVDAVPAKELGSVLDEIATALDGRGPALRRLLEAGDDLSGTLAERTELFDQLAGELTRLTATLTAERDSIGQGFDGLALVVDSLAQSRADLDTLLDEAPAFGAQVDALLQQTIADLGCSFGSIGNLFEAIGDEEQIRGLLRVLDVAEEADVAFNTSVIEAGDGGADGPYLTGSFGLVFDDPPPVYDPRPTLPRPPSLRQCPGGLAGRTLDAGGRPVAVGDEADAVAGHDLEVSPRPPAPSPDLPESSDLDVSDQRFPLALALLAVTLALAGVIVIGRRRMAMPPSTPASGDADGTPRTEDSA